ncbi:protein-S-isoprenylcysteine methyltransferase [Nitzschia inconspicua]|uniref:Protein-S-isoprenylcysteine methyltransferase n=1 Tax=Nitzschia inconspicua TaxID=303405 RepID=A0A9K3LLK7_9STRA|nr:protein-S-isoprenylcysteine methyltransferase [Nitzschia inconspicua]
MVKSFIAISGYYWLIAWTTAKHNIIQVSGFAPSTTSTVLPPRLASSALFSFDGNNKGGNSFSVPDIDFSSIGDSLSNFDVDRVVSNVKGDGEPLGSRGEYYTVAQFVLIFCIAIGGIPYAGPAFQFIGGPGLLLGGLVVTLKSFGDLGSDSLSPYPSPPRGGALKTDGIYGQMRHPMYTGLLMVMAGLSIATNSADRLLLTALLWYLLEVKSDKEEDFLMEEYGQEYIDYKAAVPGKFVPADLLDDMPWNQKE